MALFYGGLTYQPEAPPRETVNPDPRSSWGTAPGNGEPRSAFVVGALLCNRPWFSQPQRGITYQPGAEEA